MDSFKSVRFVLIYTMILNLAVTAAKVSVGYVTGSLSIIADGFDSLFDSLTNVIGLVAIHISQRPADEDHPYGHRRYEILMTLLVSLLLFFTCYQILRSAYDRLIVPIVPDINVWSFAALLFSIAVHLYVAVYERRRGRELKSEFLISDAAHTSADILVTIGVMIGLVVVRLGFPIVDTVLAVLIAFLIAKIGIDIIRSSSRILTDAAALDVSRIADIVRHVSGVQSYHHIRSRGQEDDIHVDLHVRVAPDMPLAQAHEIAHEVKRDIQQQLEGVRDVIVHVEPQPAQNGTAQDGVLATIRQVAQDTGLVVHSIRAYQTEGEQSVHLHLEVPDGLSLGQAHAQASVLERRLKEGLPGLAHVITHIEPAATALAECDLLPDDPGLVQRMRDLAHGVPGIHDCHNVRLHRVEDKLCLSMHCRVDENLPIAHAHELASLVEQRLAQECAGLERVSVHLEPAKTSADSAQSR